MTDPHRLPRHAVPNRYEVHLEPDLDAATFSGTVTIHVDVATPDPSMDGIVLNAAELGIHSATIDGEPASVTVDEDLERVTVSTGSPLDAGPHRVELTFDGTINDRLRGFYRSTFIDGDGVEQVIATTQMQSTDCRRAFPCLDEPEFKAVFSITMTVADGLTVISNSPESSRREVESPMGRRVEVTFGDTMRMSTYLVAFIVGPLEATDAIDVDGVPVRVVHTPGKGHLTGFGLETAAFSLRWFREYYGIDYPGDKIDLVALPDFAAGAMENLGCITFRENLLLVDPARSTQSEKQLVVDVVAHELAHMWFGDLVTMRWWNGIWLNEAFATFMELAACAAFRPEWGRWETFGVERSVAFETDSLSSTRPVEFEVRSPADAEGMFDVLTYQKGGALLRMLEQHLGEERFRAGVSHYLKRHAYGSSETADLWDAIEETSGEPVRRIMDSWIWQPGYPLVEATLDGDEVVLGQRRFSFSDSGDATVWSVPVAVRTTNGVSRLLLEGEPVRIAAGSGAVVVNAGGHGFLRVSYDRALLDRLEGVRSLETLERYNLVDDAWNAVLADRLDVADLLDLLDLFSGEDDLHVWRAIAGVIIQLRRMTPEEASGQLAARVAGLARPALDRLGDPVEGEPDVVASLRGLLLRLLALSGDDAASVDRCRAIFSSASADPAGVDPELLSAATTVTAARGGRTEFDILLDGFRNGPTPQDQLRCLYALAEFDDADLILETCELAMSSAVKTQNAPFLLRACIANRRHGPAAWRFVSSRWAEANERFPTNTIVRMVESVKTLTESGLVDEAAAFFAAHPIPQGAATLSQILERQRVNASARARVEARMVEIG
ncbi:MAG: M1 family metallopeptidase [Ilumatobacteraceae bacterium]